MFDEVHCVLLEKIRVSFLFRIRNKNVLTSRIKLVGKLCFTKLVG